MRTATIEEQIVRLADKITHAMSDEVEAGYVKELYALVSENIKALDWTTPTIHYLHAGLPTCGLSTDVPANWPAGHRWSDQLKDITCQHCKSVIRGMKRIEKRTREQNKKSP